MALTIVIGNRNDSSWSLRGWLALRMSGAAFDEILVPLGRPDTRSGSCNIRRPARCPC